MDVPNTHEIYYIKFFYYKFCKKLNKKIASFFKIIVLINKLDSKIILNNFNILIYMFYLKFLLRLINNFLKLY